MLKEVKHLGVTRKSFASLRMKKHQNSEIQRIYAGVHGRYDLGHIAEGKIHAENRTVLV
jgi:hypothetical protein